MGQTLKTNYVCNWDCIHKEKEESCTVNYSLNNVNRPIPLSSKQLTSIPILFPKIKNKKSNVLMEGDDNENSSRHEEVMAIPICSDVSGILQNDINNQKADNTSNINSSNSITKINSQTKTINVKSKEFMDNYTIEKNTFVKDIYNPAFIQAIFKGRKYRKRFHEMQSTLRIQSEAIGNSLLNSFDKKEFKYVEGYAPHCFSIDGYLKDEENKDYLPFNLFGIVLKNRVLDCMYNGAKALYCGSLNIENQRHGNGVLYTSSGEKYEGKWLNNNFSGWGRLIETKEDKSVTEGIFYSGKINGFGKKYWCDKRYKGEFKDGLIEGFGIEESNTYRYDGYYSANNKNGKGKIVYYETHDVYEGDFKDNSLTGFGFYTWNNKHTYLGEFLNGNMNGKGKYEWPEGGFYEGEYNNNIKEGNGVFKWPDGKQYTGPFKNGQPNGIGILLSKNKEMEVEFKSGKIVNFNQKK